MLALYALLSHTISDFIFQSNNVVQSKAEMKLKGYISHAMTLFFTSIPLLALIKISSYKVFAFRVILIIILHIIVDFSKEKSQNSMRNKNYFNDGKAILFICDQLVHIFLIITLTNGVVIEYNEFNEWILAVIFNGNGLTSSSLKQIVVILYISFSGAFFIPFIFDIVYKKIDNYAEVLSRLLKVGAKTEEKKFIDEVKTGKWIGILERILISIFLFSNQISSIGFVIAVKSLARFKMMENKIFSEYYLLGTLTSVLYTFVCYAVFQMLF